MLYYNDKVARSARRLISFYRRKLRLVFSHREVSELTPLIRRQHTFSSFNNYTLATPFNSINNCSSINNPTTFGTAESTTQLYTSLENFESCRTSTTQNDSCNWIVVSEPNCVNETGKWHDCNYYGNIVSLISISQSITLSLSFSHIYSLSLSYILPIYPSTDYADIPWQRGDVSWLGFLLLWPIRVLLYITVPDSRRHPQAKYLTLVVSIMWIALISYVVAYAITVIGEL